VFDRRRENIVDSLAEPASKRGTLAKYIGNVLYTDPAGAANLLRKGISLSDKELYHIKNAQRRLTVPSEICKAHRFWDPFDLQILYDEIRNFPLPTTPFSSVAVERLQKLLSVIFDVLPDEAKRYVNTHETGKNIPSMLAISAVNWANEKPLRDLLDTQWAKQSSDNTDKAISNLQNTVAYGIPALLSPVYAMFQPKAILLGAIERGAYQPSSIIQIGNNVPRETAIAVTRHAKKNGVVLETMPEVLQYLQRKKMRYWSAIQFRHLIDINKILRDNVVGE
jgi:hypothetical protein